MKMKETCTFVRSFVHQREKPGENVVLLGLGAFRGSEMGVY